MTTALMAIAVKLIHAHPYPTAVDVTAVANNRLWNGDAALGDADGNGTLDIVACGNMQANNRRLYFYSGNGAGGFSAPVSIPATATDGLGFCSVELGDLNGDGRLDVVAAGRRSGNPPGNRQDLRVYLRGGAGWSETAVVTGTGFESGGLSLGDYDGDGDLDILATGIRRNSNVPGVLIYKNNGDGTTYTTITPSGVAPIWNGGAAWADFDGDGRLDFVVSGAEDAGQTIRRVRVYRNNGDDTWTAIDLTPGLDLGDVAWGDFNGDGRPDVAAMGTNDGTNEQILWWPNNGAGGFGAAQQVAANNAGLSQGRLALADVDRDGYVDVVANGSQDGATPQMVVYLNDGAGLFTTNPVAGGLLTGAVALGDADGNATLDLAAVGTLDGAAAGRRVRYYPSSSANINVAPNPPGVLVSTFVFNGAGVSTAAFSWSGATDNAPGATPVNLLTYNVAVSTVAGALAPYVVAPAPVFNTRSTQWLLTSTQPWVPPASGWGFQSDTTYYFRVQTVDAGLMKSAWSAVATLWTGVAPSTSVLSATSTVPSEAVFSWPSAGDDAQWGTLTGGYRIQYSSTAGTVWDRDATPSGAFTVTLATGPVTPGTTQYHQVTGLLEDTTYYAVVWSQDDAGLWSDVSNTVSVHVPAYYRSITVSAPGYPFGSVTVGQSTQTGNGFTVTYDGSVNSTYTLSASTTTPGSPWVLGSAPGFDTAALYGAFHPVQPAEGDFDLDDLITGAVAPCGPTAYTINGTQVCHNLTPGTSHVLWFRLDMPTSSSVENEQTIRVTLSAGPP